MRLGDGVKVNPFRILTVCTGNICRSPMAERLLQSGFDTLTPGSFLVESAGTGALVGSAMDPQVEGFVRLLGGNVENFVSRQLTEKILEGPDLVLALSRDHRGLVAQMAPSLVRKTFTLRELARILPSVEGEPEADPGERWKAALKRAARLRSQISSAPETDDIVDPYRRKPEVYQQMMRELSPAVATLLDWERRFH